MPFSTPKSIVPATNAEAKEEHRQLVEAIDARRAEHAALENKSQELAAVNERIAAMREDEKTAEKKLKSLHEDVEQLEKKKATLAQETARATDRLDKLNQETAQAETRLASQETELIRNSDKLARLEKQYQGIEKDLSSAREILFEKEHEIAALEKERLAALNELEISKRRVAEERTMLDQEKVATSQEFGALKTQIDLLKAEIDVKKADRERILEENARKIETAEALAKGIVEEAEKKATVIEKNLEERKGLADKRDAWQAEIQQRLLGFKMELEKLTNRKLPITIEI